MAENDIYEIISLLSSTERNYLVRNNGDKVNIDSLKEKKVGLYFSELRCDRFFTPKLVEIYNELSPNVNFEIVYVSADKDDESFKGCFSEMPWLAIPFSDFETREKLNKSLGGAQCLVIIGENGKVLTSDGIHVAREYGVDAYPFTWKRAKEIDDQKEEEARRNQSLTSLLVTPSRDFVISADGTKVPVKELEGKTVGLYFWATSHDKCADFTEKLTEAYENLMEKEENFEIVSLPLDEEDGESLQEWIESMAWLSVPCKDEIIEKLFEYFDLQEWPTLVIIGPDGKTLRLNAVEDLEEHGSFAYPFTPEKFLVLDKIKKEKQVAQTLESILVSEDLNFVIGKDGVKVPISDLVGKLILLYFSAHWCFPCQRFTPELIEVYHKIKAKDEQFELIFISSDRDKNSFEEYFSEMPWLALPFGDKRRESLSHLFKISGIPKLVAIGKNGNTITTDARNLVMLHGESAYPFTKKRMREIDEESNGSKDDNVVEDDDEKQNPKDGLICEGDVCRRG